MVKELQRCVACSPDRGRYWLDVGNGKGPLPVPYLSVSIIQCAKTELGRKFPVVGLLLECDMDNFCALPPHFVDIGGDE